MNKNFTDYTGKQPRFALSNREKLPIFLYFRAEFLFKDVKNETYS